MSNYTTSKHKPKQPLLASEKPVLVLRLTPERKRQVRMHLAASGETAQSLLERGLELALAQMRSEKN